MRTLGSLLEVRPNEERLALGIAVLFMCLQAGQGLGDNAAAALFFLRFGVDFLPYMYVLLGAFTFALTLGYAAGLARLEHRKLFRALMAGAVALLVLERLALLRPFPVLYPILWLTISCTGMILGTLSWNVAGEVSDARQAKRLFPLFTSAGILGSVVGNAVTGLVAKSLGTENLLLFQAGLLLIGFFVMSWIGCRYLQPGKPPSKRARLLDDLRGGYDFVRGSRLMKLTSYAAILFSVMFFSLAYPFSKVVTASFPNEAAVAGFLGLFTSITTAVTFLASLLIANRIYAKIGIVNSILILPVVYAAGFAVFAGAYSLPGGVIARSAQLIVLSGIASSAYNALFNVVPPQKRGQVLAFDNGVPSQIGVALSGVLLVLGNRVLSISEILVMGLAVTLVCGFLVWKMRGAYGEALVDALRAGRIEVFNSDSSGFSGLRGDAGALQAALSALQDSRPTTRRIAAEILGRLQSDEALAAIKGRLADPDPGVRAALVRTLGQLGANKARQEVTLALSDPADEVCLAALSVLNELNDGPSQDLRPRLEFLFTQGSLQMRKQALIALFRLGAKPYALIQPWLDSDQPALRAAAVETMGSLAARGGAGLSSEPVFSALKDASPSVRAAACRSLAEFHGAAAARALAGALSDHQPLVRQAASDGLRRLGPEVHEILLGVLESGDEQACDAALEALTPGMESTTSRLREYAHAEIARLRTIRAQIAGLPEAGAATRFLRDKLLEKSDRGSRRLVRVAGLISNSDAMEWVRKAVTGSDGQTRAAAIEALETLGERGLARDIIDLLEHSPAPTMPAKALGMIMDGGDRWSRALAVRSATELALTDLRSRVEQLTTDPDPLVSETATYALAPNKEIVAMTTLKTVSTLERVLLLREVPILSELSPEDLERVAEIAKEEWYPAETAVCIQGEEGNVMYIIVDGRMLVIRSSNGEKRVLAERSRGDFVGEMAIIESAPRSATLLTDGEARVLTIDGDTFKGILRERPDVSLAMLRNFSRRLRDMSA